MKTRLDVLKEHAENTKALKFQGWMRELIGRLEVAEELNDDQAHKLGKLEHGIQKYLDGDNPSWGVTQDGQPCPHGTAESNECATCVDDYFGQLLKGAIP